jgi:hypothetical protein
MGSQLKFPGIKYVTVFFKFVDFSYEKQQNCQKLYKIKKNSQFSIHYCKIWNSELGYELVPYRIRNPWDPDPITIHVDPKRYD